MSTQANWTEQFKISDATLAKWKTQQAKSQISDASPLFWGLANGQLPELEYYNWAQEKFELPFVRSDYFAIPVDPVFWDAVKDLHSWSASLYPLAMWDGVLLIGCVEPPKGFAYPRPYRFVLASARHLQMLWANLNPDLVAAQSVRQVAKVTDPDPLPSRKVDLNIPDGLNYTASPVGPNGTQTGVVDMHTFPDGVAPSSIALEGVDTNRADGIGDVAMNEVDLSIPDGLDSENADFISAADSAHDSAEAAAYAEVRANSEFVQEQVEEGADFQAPEEVQAPKFEMSADSVVNVPIGDFAEPEASIDSAAAIPMPSHEFESQIESGHASGHASGYESGHESAPEEVAEFAAAPEQDFPAASEVTATVSAIKPEAVIEPTMTFTGTNSPDINWVIPVDPMPLDRARSVDELALHTLSAVSRQFNGAIMFLRSPAGYKPWKFTAPFRTPKKDFGVLDLSSPSIFRIVDRTHLPYHGYIEPSPENDRFFKAFLGGLAPAHITVTPILSQKICIGLIVGINDNTMPYKHILPILDGLANQFAINYKRLDSSMAASA